MRKLTALFLTAAALFAVSCGAKPEGELPTLTPTPAEQTAPTQTATPTEQTVPTQTATPTPTPPSPTPEPSPSPAAPIPDSITAWDGHVIVKERSDMDFSAPGLYDIAENTIYLIDVNGDGVTEEVSISNTTFTHMVEWPDGTTFESTSQGELYVTVNGKDGESLVSPQYAEDAHFLRRENGAVALIFIGRENDYSDLFIFAFRDTAPVLMEYRSFLRFTSLTPSSLTLEGRYFFFGNMGVTIDCVLNEDFSLTLANDGFFEVTRFIVDYLITKLPLDAELKTGGEYRDATLPVGSKIRPTFVSETGCMIFETSDGRTGRLFTDGRTINGVSEYDMFENVKYVGV